MNDHPANYNEIDDYIATFSEEERQELETAKKALDLAYLLHQARINRGLSQTAAAEMANTQQQAISRWERSLGNIQLATLERYLEALGYTLNIIVTDKQTGDILGSAALSPS